MYSRKDYNATECSSSWMYTEDDKDTTSATLKHLEYLPPSGPTSPTPPSASSSNGTVPRTSRARLSQPDVSPTPFPNEPILLGTADEAKGGGSDLPTSSSTVLYLAYGSNMCAKTFLGMRKIRPLSQVVVSAPSIRLTFDLPGIPYLEPCFANIALRKLPKKPPVVPIPPLDPPHLPPPGQPQPQPPSRSSFGEEDDWNMDTGGLIGVVYEVNVEDYARILATEGGGTSYHEILVPCIELPAPVRIPEHPRPELPKPFLARTLYAPQLPHLPEDDPKNPKPKPGPRSYSTFTDGPNQPHDPQHPSDPNDPKDPKNPELPPKWRRTLQKLLLPIHRPQTPRPPQPSLRYLSLLRSGAVEHELPASYCRYLENMEPYTITSCRQQIGRLIFMIIWMPLFMIVLNVTKWVADDKGKIPGWMAGGMAVMMHFVWGSYDWVFKPLFGEGERTVHEDDGDCDEHKGGNGDESEKGWVNGRKRSGSSTWLSRRRSERAVDDEEKRCLLSKLGRWEEDE